MADSNTAASESAAASVALSKEKAEEETVSSSPLPSDAPPPEEEPTVGDNAEALPSLESDHQEERIRARRLRIAQRQEAARRAAEGKEEETGKPKGDPALDPDPHRSNQRIVESHQTLDTMREQGMERVTLVRVASDVAESRRRQENEQARAERRQRLQEEREKTMSMFDRINSQWDQALEHAHAPELAEALQKQQRECQTIINSKDGLIGDMQGQLKARDDDYVRLLRGHASDVDTMLGYMDDQVKGLTKEYRRELEDIEKTFMQERQELVAAARREWDDAMNERRNKEMAFIQRSHDRVEGQEHQLEHLRTSDSEEYNTVKRKLEQDIMQLEQQLQQMKATYQLNTEKLEYNYQVLKKRDEENTVTISQQKRKINKLQDILNNLRAKIAKQERQIQLENMSLTEEYTRVSTQFQELQKKARHFQALDRKRLDDVWDMNEETNVGLARNLLDADRVIHEQQLGLQWVSPLSVVFDSSASEQDLRSRAASAVAKELMQGVDMDDFSTGHLTSETLRRILMLLCEESGFLVDDKLDQLLTPLSKQEQRLIRLDAVFKALNVTSDDDLKLLAGYFVKMPSDDEEASQREGQPLQLIDAIDVPAKLRLFVEDQRRAKGLDKSLESSPGLISRNPKFWERLIGIVPPSHERVYGALADGMEKYKELLEARAKGIEDTERLRQQNNELRMLLKQYMQSDVNKQLVIPPTDVLAHQARLQQEAIASEARAAGAAAAAGGE